MIPPIVFGLLLHSVCALGQDEKPVDPRSPIRYIPSHPPAVIAGLLYLLLSAACIIWARKRWARFMLTIIIGGICYAAGLFLRLPFGNNMHNYGLYSVMNLLTVLSPCGFIATVYMLLGRLAIQLQADDFLLVKSTAITKLFVTSDIVTLLVQASGGSMTIIDSMRNIGSKIFLTGLIIQLISFIIYMVVFGVFIYRMRTQRPLECQLPGNNSEFFSNWTALAGAMVISCIGILIRSVFRTLEYSEGFDGPLAAKEIYFYVLDALPLFIATIVFVITWPPLYLTGYNPTGSVDAGVELGRSGYKGK